MTPATMTELPRTFEPVSGDVLLNCSLDRARAATMGGRRAVPIWCACRHMIPGKGGGRGALGGLMRSVLVFVGVLVAVVLMLDGPPALAGVGDDGAFSTEVTVKVPPFHGIEPSIALRYGSSKPDGLVGVGWRLDAGSYITRAGSHGGAPRFDDTDVFMLDGAELMACAPDCKSGGTHETRRGDFTRIVFDGKHWTRWRPDGVKLIYEPLPLANAKGTYRWALATVTDTHANTVKYDHQCDGSECYLNSIAYADGPEHCLGAQLGDLGKFCVAGPEGARVRFYYEARLDPVSYGTGTTLAVTSKRLKTIALRMGGELVSAYALGYETSKSTGGTLLRSVQTFPSDASVDPDGTVSAGATKPQPPTVFSTASMSGSGGDWSSRALPTDGQTSLGDAGSTDPPYAPVYDHTTISIPAGVVFDQEGNDVLLPHGKATGDFDGDGRADWAVWGVRQDCEEIQLNAVLAANTHADPVTSTGSIDARGQGGCSVRNPLIPGPYAAVLTADVNADHRDDLVVIDRNGALTVATSQGDGSFAFAGESTAGFGARPKCSVADVDGDGRSDLVCIYTGSDNVPRIGTARSLPGGGFAVKSEQLATQGTALDSVQLATGDVNADGKDDAMVAVQVGCGQQCSTWTLETGYADGPGGFASWSQQQPGWTTGSTPLGTHYQWKLDTGDFDGDGRGDVVLTRTQFLWQSQSGNDVAYVATSSKGATTPFVPKPAVQLGGTGTVVGDSNGDGKDDLLASNGEALATGEGMFAWTGRLVGGCGVPTDTNGDGRTDRICFGEDDSSTPATVAASDVVSPNRPVDLHRWMPADVTGTGRQSLVYVRFSNPGYEVYTLTRQPSGEFIRTSQPIAPKEGMPLTNANAGAWMPIDVGSPTGGGPDGRTDLVMLERDDKTHTLRVYTLLSTGTGWTPRPDTPWRVNGTSSTYGSADVQNWSPAKLNRDGCGDLVHLLPVWSGVRIEYLRSNCDGTWTSGTTPDYFTNATADAPALTAPNVQDFHSTDVNGDQFTDFVFAEGRPGNMMTIRTLVGGGDASFTERSDGPFAATAPQVHGFQPMDFNGDGLRDLGLIRHGGADCLWLEVFISTGTGWTTDEAPINHPECPPPVSVADTNNIRLLDADHDNRTDALHISRYLDHGAPKTAMHMMLNRPGQHWPVLDPPALALKYPDTWAYMSMDTDGDGRDELVHVDGSELATARFDTSSDLLSAIDNGRGATTRISYRSLAGARSYLPSDSLPTVVDKVTISDGAHDPPVQQTTSWAYDGARWSDQTNQLLGFETVRATQGQSITDTRYQLSDACGARPASTSAEDTKGNVLTLSDSRFVDVGASPPFKCLTQRVVERDCEQHDREVPPAEGHEDDPKEQCRQNGTVATKTTTVDYDDYGNLTSKTETGAQAGARKTTTEFRPNTGDYVADRPARQQTYGFDPNTAAAAWRLEAATEYIYDANTAWDRPPGAKGELRRTRAWYDRSDRYVETSFEYDQHGNPTKTTSPTGVVEQTFYDPDRSLFPVKICNPRIGCSGQTWKLKYGAPEAATDLNGQITTHEYDAYGRQTRVTNPDGGTSTTTYLDEGSWQGPNSQRQRIRTEISDGSEGDGKLWEERLLDGLGRVYKTVREGDGSGPIVSETRFTDASERPALTVAPHVGCCGGSTQYHYDEAHRPTATILPDGSTTKIEYRPSATVTTDPMGRETTTARDEFGRTARVEQLDRHPCAGCPSKTYTTKYAYDALDRRTRITDAAGNITETVWDSLGRKISEHDPDRGQHSWSWRDDSTPDTETDGEGQITGWSYDDAGRPIRKTEQADADTRPARTISWSWDRDPADGQTHGYSLGRVVRVAHSSPVVSGATDTWYDRMGRAERTRQCADDSCAELGFSFDQAGRLATITYPDAQRALSNNSERVTQSYDTAGRLASLTGLDPTTRLINNTPYATELSYDAVGQLKQLTHSNGLIDSLSYDDSDTGRHWLDSIHVTNPASDELLYSAEYQHHPDGKIRTITETQPAPLTQEYQYDDLERLTNVTASDPSRNRSYSYDPIGRMSSSSTAGTYSYGDSAHVHAPTGTQQGRTRTYDANGNLTALHDPGGRDPMIDPGGRDLTIDWSISGMPQRIVSHPSDTTSTIGYDDVEQRVVKHDDQGATYYLGRYLEQDPHGGLVKYYWAGDQLIARRDASGSLTDYHQDRLGSTKLLTNAKGSVIERDDYDPYGKPLTPPAHDEHLWQGQRHDHDSGLTYMNARYYDPELGRFASPDSIIPDPYHPQSLDHYAYTDNDPANNTDPSGHMKMSVDLKKEQEQQGFAYGWMYFRALQSQCATWGQCPETAAPAPIYTQIPGKAKPQGPSAASGCRSCTLLGGRTLALDPNLANVPATTAQSPASDPAEWAQWPGESAQSDPSEWAQWLSPPPLISAPSRITPGMPRLGTPSDPPLISSGGKGVDVTYDGSTGKLSVLDWTTGRSFETRAESGGKPFGDPIPVGEYDILERSGRSGFFRLDPVDITPRNDIHEPSGRDHFRLHHPGRTIGCIAVCDAADWRIVEDIIRNTSTETVSDMFHPFWKVWWEPTPITRFGRLTVK
jgi:RHS repeat-associated protein